jgi:lysosomal Pro-X carboxypeptidase
MEQQIDHFRWDDVPGTFKQRYYVYDKLWKPGGPIFFYVGNEADVGLYVNHTGLMWESAAEFNALLVFAEHRYWGKSCLFPEYPCGDDQRAPNPNVVNKQYLTYEQVQSSDF